MRSCAIIKLIILTVAILVHRIILKGEHSSFNLKNTTFPFKAQSHIPSRTQKMKKFGQCVVIRWACIRIRWWFDESAGWTLFIYCVRQPLRTFSACPKMWAFFLVWIWTPEERQSNASLTLGTSRAHALNSLFFVDRGLFQSHVNDAQSTHKKMEITIWVRIVKNVASWLRMHSVFLPQRANKQRFANALDAYSAH